MARIITSEKDAMNRLASALEAIAVDRGGQ